MLAAVEVEALDPKCIGARVKPLFLGDTLDVLLAREHARLKECSVHLDENVCEVFAVVPTRDYLEWECCSGVLHGLVRQHHASPTHCGVKVDDREHNPAFLLWARDIRALILYVLYTPIPEDESAVAVLLLLRAALAEAHRFGLRHIKIWDPSADVAHLHVTQHVSIVSRERSDSLSSLLVFKHARDDTNADVRPKWLHNERFAWV